MYSYFIKQTDNIAGAGQSMAELFAQNDTLTLVDVSGNQVNHTTTKLIKTICKKNRVAKKVSQLVEFE